jgi:hypothetical protein
MNRHFLLLSAVFAVGVGAAHAADRRFFAGLDYWMAGGVYDDVEGILESSWSPPATSDVSADISGAAGFRAGVLFPTPLKGLAAGGSLGYVLGPTGKFHSFAQTSTPSTWDETYEFKNGIFRVLPQVRYEVPLSEAFRLGLDAGAGLAFVKTDADHACVATGSGICGSPNDSASQSFSGLTYEVGPSLIYEGSRVNLEFGVTYAGFPTEKAALISGVSYVPEFKWNPVSVHVGVGF